MSLADLPMPATTQRAHVEPAWQGDRLAALADVAALPVGRDGIRAADRNLWAGPFGPSCVKNGKREPQDRERNV